MYVTISPYRIIAPDLTPCSLFVPDSTRRGRLCRSLPRLLYTDAILVFLPAMQPSCSVITDAAVTRRPCHRPGRARVNASNLAEDNLISLRPDRQHPSSTAPFISSLRGYRAWPDRAASGWGKPALARTHHQGNIGRSKHGSHGVNLAIAKLRVEAKKKVRGRLCLGPYKSVEHRG